MTTLEPKECAELIKASKSVVALTGAGISTSAGIPDFRGPKGLYVTKKYDPEIVFNINWFHKDPKYFFEFSRDFTNTLRTIKPTFTHDFLANLEKMGLLSGIITQNIDMLHQKAGNRHVIELHGSYQSATCQSCQFQLKDLTCSWWYNKITTSNCSPVVLCPECGGYLKPDIVFFGESVISYESAQKLINKCDLLLILGSSLNVAPASLLPRQTNSTTIIVNKGDVALSVSSHRYFINEELDAYFIKIAEYF